MENNQQQKTYFGNGKEHVFPDGGSVIRVSFKREELERMLQCVNERGYLNLNVNKRRTPSQYGDTHSISLDTWQPNQQQAQQATQQAQQPHQQYAQQPPAPAPAQYQQNQPAPEHQPRPRDVDNTEIPF